MLRKSLAENPWKLKVTPQRSISDYPIREVNEIPARVPGQVHLDLLENGILEQDPHFGLNDTA